MTRLKTISKDYLRLNKELHKSPQGFGGGGARHVAAILQLAEQTGAKTLLDYGAGQCKLSKALKDGSPPFFESMQDYDPAIIGISESPRPADLVACTDVLEHIEPAYLDNVLQELFELTRKSCYLEIATRPANKTLPDGRNAHLIVEGEAFWMEKLSRFNWEMTVDRVIHEGKTPPLRAIIVRAVK